MTMRHRAGRLLPLATLLAAAPLAAQADSTAGDSAAPAVVTRPLSLQRASWLADRQPLRVGDLITIVVDEQTKLSERTSTVATEDRGSRLSLNPNALSTVRLGPEKSLQSGLTHNTRDVGQQSRDGDIVGVITVKVTELDDLGNASVSGTKALLVDGRKQEILLEGTVRPDDVSSTNTVQSSRIADASITFKGKKIGARKGILGSILSIFWP